MAISVLLSWSSFLISTAILTAKIHAQRMPSPTLPLYTNGTKTIPSSITPAPSTSCPCQNLAFGLPFSFNDFGNETHVLETVLETIYVANGTRSTAATTMYSELTTGEFMNPGPFTFRTGTWFFQGGALVYPSSYIEIGGLEVWTNCRTRVPLGPPTADINFPYKGVTSDAYLLNLGVYGKPDPATVSSQSVMFSLLGFPNPGACGLDIEGPPYELNSVSALTTTSTFMVTNQAYIPALPPAPTPLPIMAPYYLTIVSAMVSPVSPPSNSISTPEAIVVPSATAPPPPAQSPPAQSVPSPSVPAVPIISIPDVPANTASVPQAPPVIVVGGSTQTALPVVQPPSIVAGGSVAAPSTTAHYIVASQTLIPGGPAITIAGTPISLIPSGSIIVVGGSSQKFGFPTVTNSPIVAAPGAPVITLATLSLAPSVWNVVAGGVTYNVISTLLPPSLPKITIGGSAISPNSAGQYVVGSQTLMPDGPDITISGTPISLAASASNIVIGGVTQILVPTIQPQAPTLTIGGSNVLPSSAGQYIVGSQTLVPGRPAITVSGTPISLASSAFDIVLGGVTQFLNPAPAPTLTIGGIAVSRNSAGDCVLGSQTLVPGGPAITVSGTPISLAQYASDIVIGGVTETLNATPTGGIGGYIISALGGVFSTPNTLIVTQTTTASTTKTPPLPGITKSGAAGRVEQYHLWTAVVSIALSVGVNVIFTFL